MNFGIFQHILQLYVLNYQPLVLLNIINCKLSCVSMRSLFSTGSQFHQRSKGKWKMPSDIPKNKIYNRIVSLRMKHCLNHWAVDSWGKVTQSRYFYSHVAFKNDSVLPTQPKTNTFCNLSAIILLNLIRRFLKETSVDIEIQSNAADASHHAKQTFHEMCVV